MRVSVCVSHLTLVLWSVYSSGKYIPSRTQRAEELKNVWVFHSVAEIHCSCIVGHFGIRSCTLSVCGVLVWGLVFKDSCARVEPRVLHFISAFIVIVVGYLHSTLNMDIVN